MLGRALGPICGPSAIAASAAYVAAGAPPSMSMVIASVSARSRQIRAWGPPRRMIWRHWLMASAAALKSPLANRAAAWEYITGLRPHPTRHARAGGVSAQAG